MFENVLGQPAASRLGEDISRGVLAPSMLFQGPAASGKGTAALELGRILSCESTGAPWNCACAACSRHRLLYHPDLMALGSRPFSAEIAAAAQAFAGDPDSAARPFFIRSVRKLLLRFSPVLWEDEPKFSKLLSLIDGLETELDEAITQVPAPEAAQKLCAAILKNAQKLEAEGLGELIPAAQVRRAAYWCNLAPQGKRKLLLIENADRMRDEGRNSLLKLLEEPPPGAVIVLAATHGDALLPTILSRLRPYRFHARPAAVETEVIRRVFKGSPPDQTDGKAGGPAALEEGSLIGAYLDSFLPVSQERLYPLAAFFIASLTYQGALILKHRGLGELPAELVALGKYTSPIAEAAGLGRPARDIGSCIQTVMDGAQRFDASALFKRFFTLALGILSASLRQGPFSPQAAALGELTRRLAGDAVLAALTYNQNPALALERFCAEFKQSLPVLYGAGGGGA
ncbi:MAG: DNA polymerase III [Treponema sp.]|jgi:DNA polymerase-3 subunit gamma/tau|nr:DNA polymerase III [Treponema sp.]